MEDDERSFLPPRGGTLEDLLFPRWVIPPAARRVGSRVNIIEDSGDGREKGEHEKRERERKIRKRNQTNLAFAKINANPERRAARLAYTREWCKRNVEKRRAARNRHNAKPETKLRKNLWHHKNKKLKGRPRGEAVKASKLTEALVREIRALYAAGGVSMATLAAKFGVAFATIQKIVRGKGWAHVK